MYCQNCGKEIEEKTEKCPHCGSVIFNVFVPTVQEEDEDKEEKKEVSVKAVKPEKKMRRPSTKPITVTSIVMYAVLFVNYSACGISDFLNGHPYGWFMTVLDVAFAALFLAMLIVSSLGKITKKLTLAAFASYCILVLAYSGYIVFNQLIYLAEAKNLGDNWAVLVSIILRLFLAAAMTIVLVFAFIFHLEKKFSPLPITISAGIYIIIAIAALIFDIIIMALGIVPLDLFVIFSAFAVFTYFGITIAQTFLFHSQDKYRIWLENNSIR